MSSITRKNMLAINISKLENKYPEDYKFVPKT